MQGEPLLRTAVGGHRQEVIDEVEPDLEMRARRLNGMRRVVIPRASTPRESTRHQRSREGREEVGVVHDRQPEVKRVFRRCPPA